MFTKKLEQLYASNDGTIMVRLYLYEHTTKQKYYWKLRSNSPTIKYLEQICFQDSDLMAKLIHRHHNVRLVIKNVVKAETLGIRVGE